MQATRTTPIPWIAAAALLAVGCAASPSVRAVDAKTVSTSAEGSSIHLKMELENPNDAPVELTMWDYSVSVNDQSVYSGQWVASLTVPPKERMLAEIPAFVPASAGDVSGARWRVSGILSYRATGKLDKLLYQLGINRLSTLFEGTATGVAAMPAPAAAPAGAPAATAAPGSAPAPAPAPEPAAPPAPAPAAPH